jgi:hypothetical protein
LSRYYDKPIRQRGGGNECNKRFVVENLCCEKFYECASARAAGKRFAARGSEPFARQAEHSRKRGKLGRQPPPATQNPEEAMGSASLTAVASLLQDKPTAPTFNLKS